MSCTFLFSSSRRQTDCDVSSQFQLDVDLSQLEAAAEIQHSWRISRLPLSLQTARWHRFRFSSRNLPKRPEYRGIFVFRDSAFRRIHFSNCVLIFLTKYQSHAIQGLQTFTQYMISLQVFNPEGLGPSTTVIVMTDEGGKSFSVAFVSPSSIRSTKHRDCQSTRPRMSSFAARWLHEMKASMKLPCGQEVVVLCLFIV